MESIIYIGEEALSFEKQLVLGTKCDRENSEWLPLIHEKSQQWCLSGKGIGRVQQSKFNQTQLQLDSGGFLFNSLVNLEEATKNLLGAEKEKLKEVTTVTRGGPKIYITIDKNVVVPRKVRNKRKYLSMRTKGFVHVLIAVTGLHHQLKTSKKEDAYFLGLKISFIKIKPLGSRRSVAKKYLKSLCNDDDDDDESSTTSDDNDDSADAEGTSEEEIKPSKNRRKRARKNDSDAEDSTSEDDERKAKKRKRKAPPRNARVFIDDSAEESN